MLQEERWKLLPWALVLVASCNDRPDGILCAQPGCDWSEEEWSAVAALADLPDPPPDPSNKYAGSGAAEILGQKFFHDPRFSGPSLLTDTLRRPVAYGRSAKGQPLQISCVTCHDPLRGGVDVTSVPGHVSIGAGWADTNALSTFNNAYYTLMFWNGRGDSLWSQAIAAAEGALMNGNRLQTAWLIHDRYRDEYDAVFTEHPSPLDGKLADVQALVEASGPRAGQCTLAPGCPAACREARDPATGAVGCWPRFPLAGKPGSRMGCQPGDPGEPFGDAFDCMAPADQAAITRVLVNWAKAIAAYEMKLVSRQAPFDLWVQDVRAGAGATSTRISPLARRGARLFVGKAACVECHNTPFFSDNGFHNVGVPQVGPGVPTEADCPAGGVCDCAEGRNCLPWGARDGLAKLRRSGFLRTSMWSDQPGDKSRQPFVDLALEQVPKGGWRTPSLRSVALTAPYMHDGALATLEDVIAHYNVGGSTAAPGARSARVKPLFLTTDEQGALVAFLKSLTGQLPPAELITPPPLP